MAARLMLGCGRAAGWASLPRGPVLSPRRGCGEAAGLRAMGFSQEQARRLLELQPRLGPSRREAAAEQLLLLGLSAEAALGLLERSPALLRMPTERLRERAEELRRLGLDGGKRGMGRRGAVQPGLGGPFTPAALRSAAAGGGPLPAALQRAGQEDGGGGAAAAGAVPLHGGAAAGGADDLPRRAAGGAAPPPPPLPGEEWAGGGVARRGAGPRCGAVRYPACPAPQYAYFRMGVQQKEMVKARLFRTPFAELRNRHIFLERRGFYQTPHKGQTQTGNPKLRDILQLPEKDFLASLARSTPEEYEVFKKLLAQEDEDEDEDKAEDRDALYTEEDKDFVSEGSKTAWE